MILPSSEKWHADQLSRGVRCSIVDCLRRGCVEFRVASRQLLIWDVIDPRSTPWMAAGDAFQRQPAALDRAVFFQRF